ncbi:hypothetical protein [Hyphococcus luteus]|uniref:Uncharacterized protein n=1 Tax=Hyphococcus luteus TaxID=2058213 RepID=A0A2S7K3W2_9PROT|nr:hypothetical protein [Marinicaulis flavus]PQA87200.1 hypothetical protein CW354_14265 [Marinicaulis flavus]
MKNTLLASLIAVAACASDPLYDDPVQDVFRELENNRNANARTCSYRFDDVEAAATTLDEAIRAGDATRYAPDLDRLKRACDGFYSVDLFPDSFPRPRSTFIKGSCAKALMKAGDPTIGRQMVERANALCEAARGLPANMPDQPGGYEQ